MKSLRLPLVFIICALPSAGKAPFRMLYNNDTTNLESCVAPFHPKNAPFTVDVLKGSIDEAVRAGADCYMFSPGLTWVPLWKSKIYPPAEHMQWWLDTFKRPMSTIGEFVLNGGDLVEEYVAYCKANKITAFLSLRVNDYHHVEDLDARPGARMHPSSCLAVDRFRREHPELRIAAAGFTPPAGSNIPPARDANVMNWGRKEVRERLLGFIRELCEGYDIDGLELDFLRHFRIFPDGISSKRRVKIVTDFTHEVRKILDRSSREGKRRWLCARVPAFFEAQAALGIDLPKMTAAGLDMINLSSNYYTVQNDLEMARVRKMNPGAAIYLEMTHVTYVGPDPRRGFGDSNFYRRTTDEQFYTTAHLAYASGLDGVSLFNFAYYREYGGRPERGPFNEPPFHVINKLKDRGFIASSPQHYFLSDRWRSPYGNRVQLVLSMTRGRKMEFDMIMAPPARGWKTDARLRVQSTEAMSDDTQFEIECNGVKLAGSNDVSEPYANPYPPLLGSRETLRAWRIPREALKIGKNIFQIRQTQGGPALIYFIDAAIE
ncbi:MAG: hypothetical protein LBI02_02885 [Opitutaceae bacterium]|nr:hypothetical protein [Opitutaceae bacterium]